MSPIFLDLGKLFISDCLHDIFDECCDVCSFFHTIHDLPDGSAKEDRRVVQGNVFKCINLASSCVDFADGLSKFVRDSAIVSFSDVCEDVEEGNARIELDEDVFKRREEVAFDLSDAPVCNEFWIRELLGKDKKGEDEC